MNYLLSGVSIVTFGGLLYSFINLFLAKKTDVIFFTEGKRLLVNIVNMIIIVIFMSILIYIFPLQFAGININDRFLNISASILSILFIAVMITYLLNQIKFFHTKKVLKAFYTNKICEVVLILVLLLSGSINILKIAQFKNNYYINSNDIFAFSIIWTFISVFIFQLYKSEYKKIIRQICWVDYIDLDRVKSEKYYIFYASDNEYVVCGKNDRYEENDEFRFIKIEEIKTKHIIHLIEKGSN
jgi:hypothetical protein